ncbi:hypothetical protein FRB94_010966, partial [Tulasnella sp. JGI-2019a]
MSDVQQTLAFGLNAMSAPAPEIEDCLAHHSVKSTTPASISLDLWIVRISQVWVLGDVRNRLSLEEPARKSDGNVKGKGHKELIRHKVEVKDVLDEPKETNIDFEISYDTLIFPF